MKIYVYPAKYLPGKFKAELCRSWWSLFPTETAYGYTPEQAEERVKEMWRARMRAKATKNSSYSTDWDGR